MEEYIRSLRKEIRDMLYLKGMLPNEALENAIPDLIDVVVTNTLFHLNSLNESEPLDVRTVLSNIDLEDDSDENLSKYFEYTESQCCPKCKREAKTSMRQKGKQIEWKEAHVCINCGHKFWFWNGNY